MIKQMKLIMINFFPHPSDKNKKRSDFFDKINIFTFKMIEFPF
jgi:hypothetical protein